MKHLTKIIPVNFRHPVSKAPVDVTDNLISVTDSSAPSTSDGNDTAT
jgi:hypothetical protein